MSMPNDGEIYDPNDPVQEMCLRKAKCYVDRTTNPPVIRIIKGSKKAYIDRTTNPPIIRVIESDDDYEIIGWVWLTPDGKIKSDGIEVTKPEELGANNYFIYNNMKFPPGIYYLVKVGDRKILVSEKMLKSGYID